MKAFLRSGLGVLMAAHKAPAEGVTRRKGQPDRNVIVRKVGMWQFHARDRRPSRMAVAGTPTRAGESPDAAA